MSGNCSHQTLGRVVVVVLYTVFMANHLPIQFIYQLVHRRVQIFVCAFGKHFIAFDMDTAFSALASLLFLLIFYREEHFDIDYLVKVPDDSI